MLPLRRTAVQDAQPQPGAAYRDWTRNSTETLWSVPFTAMLPEPGVTTYPGTGPTVNSYVPFPFGNVTSGEDELREVPSRATVQLTPEGRAGFREARRVPFPPAEQGEEEQDDQ